MLDIESPATAIADPRQWSAQAPVGAAHLHRLARESFGAATVQESERCDAEIRATLDAMLHARDAAPLADAFATAPAADVYRHLWRQFERAEATLRDDVLRGTVFALPVVIVAGIAEGGQAHALLPGVLDDAGAIAALLREHGALAGNQTFALANALAGAEALDLARLPALLRASMLPDADGASGTARPDLSPAPIPLSGSHETVHLRFIVGVAVAAPDVDLLAETSTGKWGMPMTQMIAGQLARPGVSVLALPHAPRRLVTALQTGRALQREVAVQVFATAAIRKLRAGVGEPSAVISAHRAADAPCGGELRLSLSSPFDAREAQGFRCPLYPVDRVADVAQMLVALMSDCRVADVRVLLGVHADRDPVTRGPLLFKADAWPASKLQ